MSPTGKELLNNLFDRFTRQAVSQEELDRLEAEAKGLETSDPTRAAELVEQRGALLRRRGGLFKARDTVTALTEVAFKTSGISPEHNFNIYVGDIPLQQFDQEHPTEVVVLEKKRKTEKAGRNPARYVDDAPVVVMQELIKKSPSKKDQFVHNDLGSIATKILQPEVQEDPKQAAIASKYITEIKATFKNKMRDAARKGNYTSVSELFNEHLKNLVDQGWRPFYEQAIKEYGGMKWQDFVDDVVGRSFRKQSEKFELGSETQKLTSYLDQPGKAELTEMILSAKLRNPEKIEEIKKEIFEGKDPVGLAKRNGWKSNSPSFDEDLRESCIRASKSKSAVGKELTNEVVKAYKNDIQKLISGMASSKTREQIGSKIKRDLGEFSAIRFLYALTGGIEDRPGLSHNLSLILFSDKSLPIDHQDYLEV